jgi:HD-like signal output (HDOD) protein
VAAGETRQERIERRLAEILRRPDFPAISEHIQRVMRSAEAEDISIRNLTNIILRDYSLTLKLLRTANSPYYNRLGQPIHSVTHAVTLLGLDSVRNLAGSLMLFEHYQGHASGLKELMLLSLLSASHAYHTSTETGFPRLEEAYISGMCRNLGEILMACYFPREYSQVLVEVVERKLPQREAALRLLGFTFEDLGQACARHWKIPDAVASSIQHWEPVRALPGSPQHLNNVTSFAHGLTASIYRRDAESAKGGVRLLVDTFRPYLGIGVEETQRIAENSIRATKDTFDALRVPLDDLRLRRQMRAAVALAGQSLLEGEAGEGSVLAGTREPDLLETLTAEIRRLVTSEAGFDLNRSLMGLEAICRGAGFDRAAFCLVDPEREHVQARLGLGEDIETLLERFRFRVSGTGSPITVALTLRQDLWIDNQRDGRFEHTELVRALRPVQFGLLPVVVDGVAIGCFYLDRRTTRTEIDEPVRAALGTLRDLAKRAIVRARSQGRAPFSES